MITSSQNTKVKDVRALLTSPKARRKTGKLVLEGVRLIQDVLMIGHRLDYVLFRPGSEGSLHNQLVAVGVECIPLQAEIFDDLSDTGNSQGWLAVTEQPRLQISEDATLLLALDAMRDPGNLGTVIRTGAAAGVDGILLLSGTVDAYNPKVIRAAMGGHFRVPLEVTTWDDLARLADDGWRIWAADYTPASRPYIDDLWHGRCIVHIGNEAHGISPEVEPFLTGRAYIPMAQGVESLNASAAAAVILFEIQRQRTLLA